MGRYYRIANATKQEIVYGYWKGDVRCSIYQVMHQFNWEANDIIFSLGEEGCSFKYDEKRKCMFLHYVTNDYLNTSDGSEGEIDEDYDIDSYTVYKYDQRLDEEVGQHIPKYAENHICRRCQYQFLETNKTLADEKDMIWK